MAGILPERPESTAGPTVDWTPGQRAFFAWTLAAGLGWSAFILFASPGWSLDDELSHYLRSRSVWENPALIFDSWTRIGRNLFHVLPAAFGLTAARLWTLAFAGVAVLLTTRLAARLGLPRAWLIPLLLCFQPWFVELSWGVLTQTPFLLLLVAGILAQVTDRLVLAGLCLGALPLVRHEGIALTAAWAALLALRTIFERRDWRRLALAALAAAMPLILSNVAAWICLGELPSGVFLNSRPTDIYGHGTLWHFLPISYQPAGVCTLILGAIGLPFLIRAGKITWPLLLYPAYFGLHSVIYWQGLFASGGYYHFLMPMAPGLSVAALAGANILLDRPTAVRRWGQILLAGATLQGFLLIHLWPAMDRPRLTLARDPITGALDAAFSWQKENRPAAPLVVCHHIYAAFRELWLETPERHRLDRLAPANLPTETLVIWENKYSDLTGLPLTSLEGRPAWRQVASFGDGQVRIFEKVR